MSVGVQPRRLPVAGPVLVTLGAVAVGVAIGAEAPWSFLGLAAATGVLLAGLLDRASARLFKPFYVEIPLTLLLIASLSLRARDASDLAENPLDAAGLVKLGATLLAFGIGVLAILTPRGPATHDAATFPIRLYALYALVAAVGIAASDAPMLTGYRVVEVIAALVVVYGAVKAAGDEALPRLMVVLKRWSGLTLAVAWVAVLVAPSIALEPVPSPIPVRIDIPTLGITSNGLGTYGALVAAWSLARMFEARSDAPRRWRNVLGVFIGLASVIGAQYRTGYIALVVVVAVLLVLRARIALMFGLLLTVGALSIWGPAVSDLEPYLLRGQSRAEAAELSGRIEWWSLAGPIWEESPVVGKGLQTASRFLLADAGYGETGTIHSTWVEVLIGTGVLGTLFLLAALIAALWRGMMQALRPEGSVAPLLVLLILTARSITGSSFEAGGFQLLLFITVLFGLSRVGGTLGPIPGSVRTPAALGGRIVR